MLQYKTGWIEQSPQDDKWLFLAFSFIVLPQSTDKNIHSILSFSWPNLGRVWGGSDMRPNEAGFGMQDDLSSAEWRVYWMQYRAHDFVTERHIHSQAVREMNAHTVQHGSFFWGGGLYFFVFLFYFASLSRYNTIHDYESEVFTDLVHVERKTCWKGL